MLRAIVTHGGAGASGTMPQWRSEKGSEPRGWDVPVSQVMTPSKDIVWLSPDDTLEEGRSLMHASGKRMLPVLSGATMLGIIEPRDIARYLHLSTAEGSRSAKDSWVSTVLRHKGMPLSTRVARPEGEGFGGPDAGGAYVAPFAALASRAPSLSGPPPTKGRVPCAHPRCFPRTSRAAPGTRRLGKGDLL